MLAQLCRISLLLLFPMILGTLCRLMYFVIWAASREQLNLSYSMFIALFLSLSLSYVYFPAVYCYLPTTLSPNIFFNIKTSLTPENVAILKRH